MKVYEELWKCYDALAYIPSLWEMKKDALYILCSENTMTNIIEWCNSKGVSTEGFNVEEYLAEGNSYDFSWGSLNPEEKTISMTDADSETAKLTGHITFSILRKSLYTFDGKCTKMRISVPLVFQEKTTEGRRRSIHRFEKSIGAVDFERESDAVRYAKWVSEKSHKVPLPMPF